MNVGKRVIKGLKELVDKFKRGEPIEATRLEKTTEGYVRKKVTLYSRKKKK